MASATRATGVAPRVSKRNQARVATMFRSAGPNAERTLGDAMVAAAAKFGPKHQAEVKAALSEDVPSSDRRGFLKNALLGVRGAWLGDLDPSPLPAPSFFPSLHKPPH